MSSKPIVKVEGREFVMEQVFDAPKERVFQAFTEAERLKHWWGPRGWNLSACKVDLREGGIWHYCMKCEDQAQGEFYGMESWGKGVYREIIPGERLVYTDYFSDADGNEVEGMPATEVILEFSEQDGKTLVASRSVFESQEDLNSTLQMGMEQGIIETWERLGEYVEQP